MVTIAANSVSVQSMAVVILPLVTATASKVIMGRTVNEFAALDILVTIVPRDVSAGMEHGVIQ